MSVLRPISTPVEAALAQMLPVNASPARRQALEVFQAAGLPHRRVEAWKYTDLRTLMREALPTAPHPQTAAIGMIETHTAPFRALSPIVIVLQDGFMVSPLPQTEAGLGISSAQDKDQEKDVALSADPMRNLNTAFRTGGVDIEVAPGAEITRPVLLLHLYTAPQSHAVYTRSSLRLGEGARLTLIELHAGADHVAYQTNQVIDLDLAARSRLDHLCFQKDGSQALALASTSLRMATQSCYEMYLLSQGAAVSRRSIETALSGEHITLGIRGACLLRGRQHGDVTLDISHEQPHGTSREQVRYILEDQARGVFQGKINVAAAAQKTDGRMMMNALQLSETAEINAKPELEIFADDVQCAHGATCGALDEDLLFYLRSRGIPHKEAENLMVQAFIGEGAEQIADETLREIVMQHVEAWLAGRTLT